MIWKVPLYCFIILLFIYFLGVINFFAPRSYSINLPPRYYLKYLLPKRSKLNWVYLGKKNDYLHPHLAAPAIIFLIALAVNMSSIFFAITLTINNQMDNMSLVSIITKTHIVIMVSLAALIPITIEIQLRSVSRIKKVSKSINSKAKMNDKNIEDEIEKEWPGFYKK